MALLPDALSPELGGASVGGSATALLLATDFSPSLEVSLPA
jgi:hypothetical protein